REKVLPFLGGACHNRHHTNYSGVEGALVGDKPMNLQLASAMVLATDVVKVFNPQSPPAREILDLAIVVIAVMVVIFAVIVGIAREDWGLRDSFLSATAAPPFLGIS